MSESARHLWRSPLLGEAHAVDLPDGTVEYHERGAGPPLVLVHGWLANANLWRRVVDRLHDGFRCIALDLPLGAHRVAMRPEADLGPDGIAALIASFLEALELDGVTLAGNDSGGAYSQIAVARHTDRVARLVLTSCETPFDRWPPEPFDYLPALARDPRSLRQAAEGMSNPEVLASPLGFGNLMKQPFDQQVLDSYVLPARADDGVMRDLAVVMGSASTAAVHSAARRLMERPDLPTRLVWSRDDPVFPLDHARRYAQSLPDADLVEIDGALSLSPEDAPGAVADAIREFARSPEWSSTT
jgi:pimeloyl-ACP methyl ester carboxylesterase